MRSRSQRAAAVFVGLALISVSIGCARNWPDEFPAPYSWQQRSAPLDLSSGQDAGVSYAVSTYAVSRPSPPLSQQELYRDDRGTPTRLDVVCVDHDGDGYGRLAISLSLSEPVLRTWHPRGWDRWVLDFADGGEISVPLGPKTGLDGGQDGLDFGFIPYVHGEDRMEEVMDGFRRAVGRNGAILTVRADFPAEDAKPPLEWDFDLGSSSRADDLLQDLVEVCGGVW
ncbi:hypothetical protein [Candidatus Poriferisocius sp.]|uniref:hypothetical protein n=1 Tax=Candidatus Poriferisocius sp. TaxID=3101276 RepID=UPI003B02D531